MLSRTMKLCPFSSTMTVSGVSFTVSIRFSFSINAVPSSFVKNIIFPSKSVKIRNTPQTPLPAAIRKNQLKLNAVIS